MNKNITVMIMIIITFIELSYYLGYIFLSPTDVLNTKPIGIMLFNNLHIGPYFVMLFVLCSYLFLSLLYIHRYWIAALTLEGLFFILEFYKAQLLIALQRLSKWQLHHISIGISIINVLLLLIALTCLYKFRRLKNLA